MKKLGLAIILILVFIGGFKVLAIQEEHERQNAIARCGGESNVITNYTNQGDKYFSCKVDK